MRKKTEGVPEEVSKRLDLLTKELSEVGVSYVGHGVVSVQGDHSGYFSHLGWRDLYLGSQFFHDEPILDAFLKNPFDVVYWKFVETNKVSQMRKGLLEVIGGMTLCNFYHTFFGFLNIGFSDDRNVEEFMKDYRPLISAYHQTYDQVHLSWRTFSHQEGLPGVKEGLQALH